MSCKSELLSFLRKKQREIQAVVMPDFFLDRILDLTCEPSQFSPMIESAAKRKGGSIDGIPQTDIRGGNAANTASALAALGVSVTPLVCTNRLGLRQLRFHLKSRRVDLSHVKLVPKASLTTALEFKAENGKTNVMLRDVGSLSDFGPEDLTDRDYQHVEDADYVCLFNWVGTLKHGTRLAESVFKRAKAKGRSKTYFDTADPTPNIAGIPELIDKVLKTLYVDLLSLNENEAITYAGYLKKKPSARRRKENLSDFALESARILAKCLPARIDLHTTNFSATLAKEKEVVVPAFPIKPLRATGAGDAWNAGNIVGDANALSSECRLALANAVSACYLSSPDGLPPTRQRLVRFVENTRFPASIT